MTFFLGLGTYFLYLYQNGYAGSVMSILFGNILAISLSQTYLLTVLTLITLMGIALISRPLLFASLDPILAASKHLLQRTLSVLFFILLAITVSMACQIVGALLVFALLIGPGATAQQWCGHKKERHNDTLYQILIETASSSNFSVHSSSLEIHGLCQNCSHIS